MKKYTYDLHISTDSISPSSITALEGLGFIEDEFYNNRNSTPVFWHATFSKHYHEPDDQLWKNILHIVNEDRIFSGTIEEEKFEGGNRFFYANVNKNDIPSLDPFVLEVCAPGEHKACDIHINVDKNKTPEKIMTFIDELNLISFERTLKDSSHRIYSLTFETLEDGQATLKLLDSLFSQLSGFHGKMKLEEIHRFHTHPAHTTQLPIVRSNFLKNWIKNRSGKDPTNKLSS